jgi:hypothetical protein
VYGISYFIRTPDQVHVVICVLCVHTAGYQHVRMPLHTERTFPKQCYQNKDHQTKNKIKKVICVTNMYVINGYCCILNHVIYTYDYCV